MQTDTPQAGREQGDLPVQGTTTIDILIHDHQIIKSLLETISDESQHDRRKETFEHLKAALTIHNATEENLVYPAIAIAANKRWEAQHLYHETAEADTLVFELDTMIKTGDEAAFVKKAGKLREAVLEHIDDEEQSAFQHLTKRADASDIQNLDVSVRKFRRELHVQRS